MDGVAHFRLQHRVNAPLAFDTRKPGKGGRHDPDMEVGSSARPCAAMTGMAGAFVFHRKHVWCEGLCQFFMD